MVVPVVVVAVLVVVSSGCLWCVVFHSVGIHAEIIIIRLLWSRLGNESGVLSDEPAQEAMTFVLGLKWLLWDRMPQVTTQFQ